MASSPRSPKSTVKVRRLPKVGDTISIRVKVTRVDGEGDDAAMTVQLANGQRSTTQARYWLKDEQDG